MRFVANGKLCSPPISIPNDDWHTPDGLWKFYLLEQIETIRSYADDGDRSARSKEF